jgi:hypothetical protein
VLIATILEGKMEAIEPRQSEAVGERDSDTTVIAVIVGDRQGLVILHNQHS